MANFLGSPKVQYFKTGTVEYLSGGKLYSYTAGTSTLCNTYPTIADANASTNPNANPVILDSRGEANVVISGPTKVVLYDSSDNLIWSVDNLNETSTDILDANGNELLKFVTTASAVNELTVTNNATGSAPSLSATGGDTNINLSVLPKGTGVLNLGGDAPSITAFGSASNLSIDLVPKGTGTLKLNGSTLNTTVQRQYSQVATWAAMTTTIPLDGTVPQITEGTEIMTVSITPKKTTNILDISVTINFSNSAISNNIAALFQDSTANALAVGTCSIAGAWYMGQIRFTHTMTAGTTSATTFRVRLGPSAASTINFNGASGSSYFGDSKFASSIIVTEYQA